jgi:hypothetical protein
MQEPIHTTKPAGLGKVALYTALLFLPFIIGLIAYISIRGAGYNRAVWVVFLVFFVFAFLLILLMTKKVKTYKIFDDKISAYSFWGRQEEKILFSDIRSWTEYERTFKSGKFYILTLYAGDHKIEVNSTNLEKWEYEKLKELAAKYGKEDIRKELEHSISDSKTSLIFLWIVLLIPVLGLLRTWYAGMNDLNTGKFVSENYKITRPLEDVYHKSGNSLILYVTRPDTKIEYDLDIDHSDPDKSLDSLIAIEESGREQSDSILKSVTESDSTGNDSVNNNIQQPTTKLNEERIEIEDYTYKATAIPQMLDSLDEGDEIFINRITPVLSEPMENFFGDDRPHICGIWYDTDEKYLTFSQFAAARKQSNTILMYVFAGVFLIICFIIASIMNSIKKTKAKLETMPQ